jgi:exodeoxyribonuclease V alpha subunit
MTVSDAREYLAREYGFSVTDINAGFESAYETHGMHEHGLHDTVKTLGERPRVIAFSENADCEKAILDTIEETRKDGVSYNAIIAPLPDKLDTIQKDAVRMALSNPISIITGGPGTGKTTICEAIANQLELVIGSAVAARAARNLFERTGIQSMTVAKFLSEASKDNIGYYDALIIDEASMISSQYMRRILQAVRSAGIERVVFVGDCDQLPPVSWGAPFADLIEGDALPITTLRKIYRTKEGGGIARLSADIRDGKYTHENATRAVYDNVRFIETLGDTDMAQEAVREYLRLVDRGIAFNDIGLLTPYSDPKFPIGSASLNMEIRKALGKPAERATVGDMVIGTKNQYNGRFVLNGSRGIVIETSEGLTIQFDCDDEPTFYTEKELDGDALPDGVAWGYASSIHKSQGGEFPHVISIVARRMARMFGKPALYTAFSRAKDTLTIVGEIAAIPTIAAHTGQKRVTALSAMLQKPVTVQAVNSEFATRMARLRLLARLQEMKAEAGMVVESSDYDMAVMQDRG